MRVILADDAVRFREGAARVLRDAAFDVTGQAGDPAELLDLVRRDPPVVAVIDIRMPPTRSSEGIDVAAELRRLFPAIGLLLLSQYIDTHCAIRLTTEFQGGVGYPLEDRVSDLDSFPTDIRRVAGGESVIDPELVARLVRRKRERDPLEALTERCDGGGQEPPPSQNPCVLNRAGRRPGWP